MTRYRPPYVPSTALQAHVLWAGSVLDQFHLHGSLTRTMLVQKREELLRPRCQGDDLTSNERGLLRLLERELTGGVPSC